MFEVKQVIEGKIFIHHRRDEMLTVFHRHEVPAQYFECFINAQNFTGHFVEIHAQPADQVRVVYIKKNSTHQIIAMLNQSQYVLHLHPLTLILGKWSFRHRVLPNTLKIFAGLFALLFILFFSYRLFSRSVPAHHHLARLHSIHSFWATVIFAVLCTAFCIALCVFPACSYITSVKDAKYQY